MAITPKNALMPGKILYRAELMARAPDEFIITKDSKIRYRAFMVISSRPMSLRHGKKAVFNKATEWEVFVVFLGLPIKTKTIYIQREQLLKKVFVMVK